MIAVEELGQALTPDQAQQFADFDSAVPPDAATSAQLLLDELLGRFEDDDPTMPIARGFTPELYIDSDE
jgi:hypothetical protein